MAELSRQEYYECMVKKDMQNLLNARNIEDNTKSIEALERVVLSCAVRWYNIQTDQSVSSGVIMECERNLQAAIFNLATKNWRFPY
jgi:hypothetical protein